MYWRYAERRGWSIATLDARTDGRDLRFALIEIAGAGRLVLAGERGGHSAQHRTRSRSDGRIHTSTSTVAVFELADGAVVALRPADVRIDTSADRASAASAGTRPRRPCAPSTCPRVRRSRRGQGGRRRTTEHELWPFSRRASKRERRPRNGPRSWTGGVPRSKPASPRRAPHLRSDPRHRPLPQWPEDPRCAARARWRAGRDPRAPIDDARPEAPVRLIVEIHPDRTGGQLALKRALVSSSDAGEKQHLRRCHTQGRRTRRARSGRIGGGKPARDTRRADGRTSGKQRQPVRGMS